MKLPAICQDCGHIFVSGLINADPATLMGMTADNNTDTCPNCRHEAKVMNILQSVEGTTLELIGGERMNLADAESAVRKVMQAIEMGLDPQEAVPEADYKRFTQLWDVLTKLGALITVRDAAAKFLEGIFNT